ncbi:MAG: DUF721 domain-containing protein [Actinobacteria bacterium]|nr:DUF721 domain-containing protein [Actinomycetota bacterium]
MHVRSAAEPATVLARVQACWAQAVGDAIAAEAEPVGERHGILTVACRSGVWAQELQLLSQELLSRLNHTLGNAGSAPLVELHVRPARRSP